MRPQAFCASLLLAFALLAGAPPCAADTPADPDTTPALLLIATPRLAHSGFRETVVLVTRHGRGGAIGLIVNRPLDVPLARLFPSLKPGGKDRLHQGGPVEPGQISYVFRGGDRPPETIVVAEQTYIARSADLLAALLRGARAHTGLRVVAGYAGWAPGQLENEISRGDWLVLPVDGTAVFDLPAASMWTTLLRRATQKTAAAPVGSGRLPEPAMLNSTLRVSSVFAPAQ